MAQNPKNHFQNYRTLLQKSSMQPSSLCQPIGKSQTDNREAYGRALQIYAPLFVTPDP